MIHAVCHNIGAVLKVFPPEVIIQELTNLIHLVCLHAWIAQAVAAVIDEVLHEGKMVPALNALHAATIF
jgi:hypothetical protein